MFLFTYGSLKKGFKYNGFLNGSFIDNAKTKFKYSMREYCDSGFPYLIKEEDFHIYGEVYEINLEELQTLDMLEDHPKFYRREMIDIILENETTLKAYCYFLSEKIIDNKKPFDNWTIDMENRGS